MAKIPLRQIRAVIAVCEEGSFTRAAERENATQSGISQHVATVERALGVKLFERTARGVTPTTYGECLVSHARAILDEFAKAREELRGLQSGITGKIRLGALSATVLGNVNGLQIPRERLHLE